MSDDVKMKLKMIKEYYDNISDNEFKERLIKAGFEIVEDIPGQFLYDEPDDGYTLFDSDVKPDFVVRAKEDLWEMIVKPQKYEIDLLGVA